MRIPLKTAALANLCVVATDDFAVHHGKGALLIEAKKKALGLGLLCALIGCSDSTGGGQIAITKHENSEAASRSYVITDAVSDSFVIIYKDGAIITSFSSGCWLDHSDIAVSDRRYLILASSCTWLMQLAAARMLTSYL